MGYTRNPKVYRITFADDTEYAGLEVVLRSLTTGQIIAVRRSDDDEDSVERMTALMADRIVSWNLENEDGTPVPPTLESIKGEDHDMTMAIIQKWTDAVSGVPAPLEQPSTSGGESLEASIPMETLSESRAS